MSDWAASGSSSLSGPDGVDPGVSLLPERIVAALVRSAAGMRLALVGGAVRDLLAHRIHRDPWLGLQDLDLVVEDPAEDAARLEPAAHRLARALVDLDPAAVGFCHLHEAFGTVELQLDALLLDLATARAEVYPAPGENPLVRPGTLETDLARRDFSVNAMALSLNGDRVELIDPHGGLVDLEARRLRLLHANSLRDDPTRLIRAARYGARLGFALDPASLDQGQRTLAAWPWPWRPGDPPQQAPPALATRLRMELSLLLEREPWQQALSLLQEWGGLALLDAGLQADRGWRLRLARASRYELPMLTALVAGAAEPLRLAERLQMPHRQHRLLVQLAELRRRLAVAGWDASDRSAASSTLWPPSRWCELLERPGLSPESVALSLACGDGPRRPLLRWWHRWRHMSSPVSAAELLAQGIPKGPELGARLRQARFELLDREGPGA